MEDPKCPLHPLHCENPQSPCYRDLRSLTVLETDTVLDIPIDPDPAIPDILPN